MAAARSRAQRRASIRGRGQNWGRFMLISVNTFWTILLIIHGLLAVALLGALTHQAMAVLMPVRQSGRQDSSRAFAPSPPLATPPQSASCGFSRSSWGRGSTPSIASTCAFRSSRPATGKPKASSSFKEHAATLGLGAASDLLVLLEERRTIRNTTGIRKSVTAVLAFICWFDFLVGHVLNNVRGFGS